MSECKLIQVKLGPAPPAPSTRPPEPPSVYLLWREAWDYDERDVLIGVHATIEGAQAEHLEEAWPLKGRLLQTTMGRGGVLPPRGPDTHGPTWIKPGTPDPVYWQPDDGTSYGIQRWEVHSATPRPPTTGDSDA